MGYSPWGCKQSDTAEQLVLSHLVSLARWHLYSGSTWSAGSGVGLDRPPPGQQAPWLPETCPFSSGNIALEVQHPLACYSRHPG